MVGVMGVVVGVRKWESGQMEKMGKAHVGAWGGGWESWKWANVCASVCVHLGGPVLPSPPVDDPVDDAVEIPDLVLSALFWSDIDAVDAVTCVLSCKTTSSQHTNS